MTTIEEAIEWARNQAESQLLETGAVRASARVYHRDGVHRFGMVFMNAFDEPEKMLLTQILGTVCKSCPEIVVFFSEAWVSMIDGMSEEEQKEALNRPDEKKLDSVIVIATTNGKDITMKAWRIEKLGELRCMGEEFSLPKERQASSRFFSPFPEVPNDKCWPPIPEGEDEAIMVVV